MYLPRQEEVYFEEEHVFIILIKAKKFLLAATVSRDSPGPSRDSSVSSAGHGRYLLKYHPHYPKGVLDVYHMPQDDVLSSCVSHVLLDDSLSPL